MWGGGGWVVGGGWWVVDGGWWVEGDGWGCVDCGWWGVEGGGWRVEGVGCWVLSRPGLRPSPEDVEAARRLECAQSRWSSPGSRARAA